MAQHAALNGMFMRGLLVALTLLWCSAHAGPVIEVNQANEAELDSLKGVGPSLSGRILAERKNGDFKDWADLMARVKGIRPVSAAKFSAQGLTVQGQAFEPAPDQPASQSTSRP